MSIFYVTLNESLLTALDSGKYVVTQLPKDWSASKIKEAAASFTRGKKYPVLAVSLLPGLGDDDPVLKTRYHVPGDHNGLVWVPPIMFEYAGLE